MASPSTTTTTLVLAEHALPAASLSPGCASMSWADAQGGGFRSFRRFGRFLCLPARFPAGVVEHQREAMLLTLRARVGEGALAVLLVPGSADDAAAAAGFVDRTPQAAEAVARTRIVGHVPAAGSRAEPSPSCPPRIAAAVPATPPAYRLEAMGGSGLPLDEPDPAEALVEHGSPLGGPFVVAGFYGAGAWLVMPSPGGSCQALDAAGVDESLALLPDLDMLRGRHARTAPRRAVADGANEGAGSPSTALRETLDRVAMQGKPVAWADLRLRVAGDEVHVSVRGKFLGTYAPAALGCADRRSRRPSAQWQMLRALAIARGHLTWDSREAGRKNLQRVYRLRKCLGECLGLEGDPIPFRPERGDRGWRTQFAVEE